MQTKLKLTALAGALALAGVSGQAAAEVEGSQLGGRTPIGGELLLQVWDSVANISYTRDLGTNFAAIATPEAVAGMSAGTTILSYTADANWLTFMGQVTQSNLQWGLLVGETIGNATAYTTTPVGQSVLVPGDNITNTIGGVYDVYIAELNGRADQSPSGDFSSIAGAADPGYWPDWSDDWSPIEQTAFGEDLAFWRIAYSGNSTDGNIPTLFQGLGGAPALWSLGSDGALTFAVAAVPEAETWALLGLGLLGAGAVARRRSRALA